MASGALIVYVELSVDMTKVNYKLREPRIVKDVYNSVCPMEHGS